MSFASMSFSFSLLVKQLCQKRISGLNGSPVAEILWLSSLASSRADPGYGSQMLKIRTIQSQKENSLYSDPMTVAPVFKTFSA